jgi:hypothetical protein
LISYRRIALLLPLILAASFCSAQKSSFPKAEIAPTPPMGWNSWDAYGLTITEDQFREDVAIEAAELKPIGWQYAVIDEGWFMRNPQDRPTPGKLVYEIDANGRYIPVPSRFPSALTKTGENTGFAALGSYVHSVGLRFGIHIVRGIPRVAVVANTPIAGSKFHVQDAADTTDACPWDPTNWGVKDNPAGQAWYDSLLAQYAAWGVDFLKVDCIASHPYKVTEIRMIQRAIAKTHRPIVLSLSPGPTALTDAKEVGELSEMWRISDDIWDFWTNPKPFPRTLRGQFALIAAWQPYAKPGNWPDADMLPIGYLGPNPGDGVARDTRLTHDEQKTQLTLWSIARSPLILGANLTRLDDWTRALITNREIIAMDQQGHGQHQALEDGELIAWTSEGAGKSRYLAIFNLGDTALKVDRPFADFGLPGERAGVELWTKAKLDNSTQVTVTLPPHGCIAFKLD